MPRFRLKVDEKLRWTESTALAGQVKRRLWMPQDAVRRAPQFESRREKARSPLRHGMHVYPHFLQATQDLILLRTGNGPAGLRRNETNPYAPEAQRTHVP